MLEQIVRPFQSPGSINDKAVPVTRSVTNPPELAVLIWGAAGQAPRITGISFKVIDKDKQLKEVSRKTHDVKITNPDDDTQFVKEQRIDKIGFKETPGVNTPSTSGSGGSGTKASDTSQENNSGNAGGANTNTSYADPPQTSESVNSPVVTQNVPNPVNPDTTQYFVLKQDK